MKPGEPVFTQVVLFLQESGYKITLISLLAVYSPVYLRRYWFYLCSKFLLNPIQVKAILVGDQIHSQTKVAKPPRSTNSVKICLCILGEIKVDYNIDSLDIYSPCKKICTHKVPACTVAEIMKNPIAMILKHFSMDVEARVAKLSDFLCQKFNTIYRVTEYY